MIKVLNEQSVPSVFLNAEAPEHLPQASMPYCIKGLLEIDEIVEQVPLMLKMLLYNDPAAENLLHVQVYNQPVLLLGVLPLPS